MNKLEKLLSKTTIDLVAERLGKGQTHEQILRHFTRTKKLLGDYPRELPFPTKALFPYKGASNKIAPLVVSHIPEHKIYVEPFLGSGAVLFRKGRPNTKKSYHEILNDINQDVTNIFKIMRDRPDALLEKLEQWEFSEHNYWVSHPDNPEFRLSNDLEKAARYLFRCFSSFGGYVNSGYALQFTAQNKSVVQKMWKRLVYIKAYSERIKQCQIYSRDYEWILKKFDGPDTFFYLDPPYKDCNYYCANPDFDHGLFAERVKSVRAPWIMSHMNDEWVRDNFGKNPKQYVVIPIIRNVNNNGAGARYNKESRKREECLVIKQ